MARRGDISLGDLLDAFRELEADESSGLAIARLLKLAPPAAPEEEREPEDAARRETADDILGRFNEERAEAGRKLSEAVLNARSNSGTRPVEEEEQPPEPVVVLPQPEEPTEESPPEDDFGPVIPSRLRPVGSDKGEVAPPKSEASLLPSDAGRGGEPQAFEPLLLPVWTRAILSGALSSRSDDGPIDIRKVIEKVAGGEPSARLPRSPRPTLARGVQVLIDRGETMLPFLEDQEWLEAEIEKVVGRGRAQFLYFEGGPARKAGPGSKSGWKLYAEHHLPPGGTVVLVVTDLGVGRPLSPFRHAGESEWLAFAERLRRRGCPLVALVPYAPERCPAALRRVMTILQWDRTTSTSSIHASVGKGHVS